MAWRWIAYHGPCTWLQAHLFRAKTIRGPLAHRVEQGTFNPKVPGSRPGRPTRKVLVRG